jgi:integrating conjugative element protein (TIGR03765 family)
MSRLICLRLALGGFWLLPVSALAELTVIYDSGDTRSIAPFLAVFDADTSKLMKQSSVVPAAGSPGGVANPTLQQPIRTPELKPGPVLTRPLPLPDGVALPRPFFLVGADPLSREWLARHQAGLAAIQAIGMLVEAETEEDVAAVTAIANGLPILPASASDIVPALKISHIPVLISERGIEQ